MRFSAWTNPLWLRTVAYWCAALLIGWLIGLGPESQAQEADNAAAEPSASPTPSLQFKLPPTVAMTADPPYGLAPLRVGFFVVPTDPDNADFISYRWNFGNGSFGTLPPLMTFATYTNPGNYVVTMTATTADGRTVTAFTSVTVHAAEFKNE